MPRIRKLHNDWDRIDESEAKSMDIGKGTVEVWEKEGDEKPIVYQVDEVYMQLIRAAYERGAKGWMPWR